MDRGRARPRRARHPLAAPARRRRVVHRRRDARAWRIDDSRHHSPLRGRRGRACAPRRARGREPGGTREQRDRHPPCNSARYTTCRPSARGSMERFSGPRSGRRRGRRVRTCGLGRLTSSPLACRSRRGVGHMATTSISTSSGRAGGSAACSIGCLRGTVRSRSTSDTMSCRTRVVVGGRPGRRLRVAVVLLGNEQRAGTATAQQTSVPILLSEDARSDLRHSANLTTSELC